MNIFLSNFKSTLCILAFLVCSILTQHFNLKSVSKDIFGGDEGGYYNYLPAFFIYQDLQFKYTEAQSDYRRSFLNQSVAKDGHTYQLNRYSTGPAILLSPFFAVAALQTYGQAGTITGFEPTFRCWVFMGLLFYITSSLFLIQKLLSRYFDDTTIACTLVVISLGSNLFYYVNFEPLMSHTYSFFLFTLSLYLMDKWLDNKAWKTMLLLGCTVGLLAVTRLPNIIFILVLFLWRSDSFKGIKARCLLFLHYRWSLLLAVVCFLLAFAPQIVYWKMVSGYWIIDPYAATGATFFFNDPFISEVLLGYKKGWLLYTPLMIFGCTGFMFLYTKARSVFYGIFLFTALNIYIVSSWSYWWYGGSFGMRALIESMVPLSFCVAATIDYCLRLKIAKVVLLSLIGLGVAFNLFQTHQYTHGLIHSFGMTRKAYWASFGKLPPLSEKDFEEYDKYLLGVYMNEMTLESRAETATYNERSERQQ